MFRGPRHLGRRSTNHPIEDVSLSNIRIVYRGGGTAEEAARASAEGEEGVPRAFAVRTDFRPGACLRAIVTGLKVSNLEVSCMTNDFRPAFILDDVKGAEFRFARRNAPQTLRSSN